MVIRLQGGLGNQLFQYAYARSRCEQPLFNISRLASGNPPRKLGLDAWVDVATTEESGEDGYWQDERLFNQSLIRNIFSRPRGKVSFENRKMAAIIQYFTYSVLVGVRRADYLWPERLSYHGVMPVEYYREAMGRFPVGSKFFIFTDDPAWCRENLDGEIVQVNGPDDKHWDIWLMSLCRYAIIANSTFHWWGAWLGADLHGKVIAPKRWFANGQPWDIVPERWTTI